MNFCALFSLWQWFYLIFYLHAPWALSLNNHWTNSAVLARHSMTEFMEQILRLCFVPSLFRSPIPRIRISDHSSFNRADVNERIRWNGFFKRFDGHSSVPVDSISEKSKFFQNKRHFDKWKTKLTIYFIINTRFFMFDRSESYFFRCRECNVYWNNY
jgi:hypothetical protein